MDASKPPVGREQTRKALGGNPLPGRSLRAPWPQLAGRCWFTGRKETPQPLRDRHKSKGRTPAAPFAKWAEKGRVGQEENPLRLRVSPMPTRKSACVYETRVLT